MSTQAIKVPDIGGAEDVDVIEVCVSVGDDIVEEQSLIVLETDKASMEIPAPQSGKVASIKVKEGDTVSEGDIILELDVATATTGPSATTGPASAVDDIENVESSVVDQDNKGKSATDNNSSSVSSSVASHAVGMVVEATEKDVKVPDIGGAESVEVIEVCVEEGEGVNEGDSLIVLESDKASMDIPAPFGGVVTALSIAVGDKVSQNDLILKMEVQTPRETVGDEAVAPQQTEEERLLSSTVGSTAQYSAHEIPQEKVQQSLNEAMADLPSVKQHAGTAIYGGAAQTASSKNASADVVPSKSVYAGPATRAIARKFGVDLALVKPSGPRNRILKEDIQQYVKAQLAGKGNSGVTSGGMGIPSIPAVDFSKFGEVEIVPMTKVHRVTAANMARSWLNVPHVTQFDEADVTDLEQFRKSLKKEAEQRGVKISPLAFIIRAVVAALQAYPKFNLSLHHDGEHIVQKHYYHIGLAVDTPNGLMVPVIKDADKKTVWSIAEDINTLSGIARQGKLKPNDMQGACFTVSSLGAIGGQGFTPIVNAPEVGILGVSKTAVKPQYIGDTFVPRQMLPLALSYDHRAVNGVDAGNFLTFVVQALSDIRRMLL